MTTLKDLSDKQVEDLKSKVESCSEADTDRVGGFTCGQGKARWDSRQFSHWEKYGHNRLYFRNAEDSYIDLKEGEVVGNDHNKEILKVNGYIAVCICEHTGGEAPETEYFPLTVVPEDGVDEQ